MDNIETRYDRVSVAYDISRKANDETVRNLVKILHIDSGSVLLDMGCGTGNFISALEQRSKSIIGIDMSTGMLEQARKKIPHSKIICGDVTFLPFGDETLDGAFAIQVLHHLKRKEKFLRETYRALKTGSYVAIHSCSHSQMRSFWFYHYFSRCLEIDLERIPDTDEIRLLLEMAGFSNIRVEICMNDTVVSGETPDRYLDKEYRDGVSTFAFLTDEEIKSGCDRIQRDISSGEVERVVQKYETRVSDGVGGSTIICGKKINAPADRIPSGYR